ncbi:MAG: hypothetical protein J7493_17185 [Porphyrobacter sp.]|nr:hypothetical protein [Porphyrobacter sp.]
MANAPVRFETATHNSPIVAAYLKAYDLDRKYADTSSDDPDAQFSYAAMQGATDRVLECGIHSLDHVAVAALLVFNALDEVVEGYAMSREDERCISVEDARQGFRNARAALKNIWTYASKEAGLSDGRWDPIVEYYGAHRT